jgi:mono/diheme cytochrome c family protein
MRSACTRRMVRLLAAACLSAAAADTVTAADASGATGTAGASLADFKGADIYSHICQGCHMSQGEGAVGAGHYPKLASNLTLASWRYVVLTVLEGRNDMPAFGAPANMVWDGPPGFGVVHLSDAQIADVVNYVRTHFGNTYKDRVSASDVAKLHPPGTAAAP